MLASHTDTRHAGSMRKPSGGCKNLDSKRPVAWLAKQKTFENTQERCQRRESDSIRRTFKEIRGCLWEKKLKSHHSSTRRTPFPSPGCSRSHTQRWEPWSRGNCPSCTAGWLRKQILDCRNFTPVCAGSATPTTLFLPHVACYSMSSLAVLHQGCG